MNLGDVPAQVWGVGGAGVGAVVTGWVQKWLTAQDQEIRNRVSYRDEIGELYARVDKLEKKLDTVTALWHAEREYSSSLRLQIIQAGLTPLSPPVVVVETPPPSPED